MSRPKLSNEQKEQLREKTAKQTALKAEEKKAFNKQFRKSPFFIISWVIRLSCIAFFVTAIYLHNTTSTINEEILTERHIIRDSSFQTETQIISTIYFTTNKGNYIGDISAKIIPGFDVGDTMLIQKNIFGKPTFFTRKHWPYKYELEYGLEIYYIVLFLTLISVGFNDVTDKVTKKLLWTFMFVDIIAIILYLFL